MEETKLWDICPDSFIYYFDGIEDPRIERQKRHKLIDIFVITLCAVISGAEAWTEIEDYGHMKLDWLRKYLDLENGIPSHDTFGRVFSIIDPVEFRRCFISWMEDTLQLNKDTVVAIDGKTVRRSHDRSNGKSAIHMVSALVAESGLVMGQIKTKEKSNEITAIPQLLNALSIKDCVITIDAMGCQKKIAAKILSKEAEFVLALKGNHGNLKTAVVDFFDYAEQNKYEDIPHSFFETFEKDHGRIEKRRCWVVDDPQTLRDLSYVWDEIKSIIRIESTRTENGETTIENREYVSSLPAEAERLLRCIRCHWSIENKLHWSLDVNFREDECRVRKDHAPENFAIIRHIAQNIIKNDHTAHKKRSVRARKKMAGWNDDYLAQLLFGATRGA